MKEDTIIVTVILASFLVAVLLSFKSPNVIIPDNTIEYVENKNTDLTGFDFNSLDFTAKDE